MARDIVNLRWFLGEGKGRMVLDVLQNAHNSKMKAATFRLSEFGGGAKEKDNKIGRAHV